MTAKSKPNDFCFAVLEDGDFAFNTVAAVKGEFSMGEGSDENVFGELPHGFRGTAEWCFEYRLGSVEEGRQALLAAGFVEVENPWK